MTEDVFPGIDFTLPAKGKVNAAREMGHPCGTAWYAHDPEGPPPGFPDSISTWSVRRWAAWREGLVSGWHTVKVSAPPPTAAPVCKGVLVGYVFHIFAALAEFERSMIRERTRAGLDAARARGGVGGRRRSLTDKDLEMAETLLANPDSTVDQLAAHVGAAPATLYRYLPGGRGSIHALAPEDEVRSFSAEPRRASKMK